MNGIYMDDDSHLNYQGTDPSLLSSRRITEANLSLSF